MLTQNSVCISNLSHVHYMPQPSRPRPEALIMSTNYYVPHHVISSSLLLLLSRQNIVHSTAIKHYVIWTSWSTKNMKFPINFSFYNLNRSKSTPKPTWRKHLFCAEHWCWRVLTIINQNKMNMHSHKTSVQPRVLSLSILDDAAVSSSLLQHGIF
jgi:hypothetical protein